VRSVPIAPGVAAALAELAGKADIRWNQESVGRTSGCYRSSGPAVPSRSAGLQFDRRDSCPSSQTGPLLVVLTPEGLGLRTYVLIRTYSAQTQRAAE
jgi:hypothetical protein